MDQNDILSEFRTKKVDLENQINAYYKDKAKGHCVRARAKWIQEGNLNSKLFSNLEKQRQSKNVIYEVKTANGNVTNDNDVLTETVKFYKNLYSETTIFKRSN